MPTDIELLTSICSALHQRGEGSIDQRPVARCSSCTYLESDPLEIQDVAGQSDFAAIERELSKRMSRWMCNTDSALLEGPISVGFHRRAVQG